MIPNPDHMAWKRIDWLINGWIIGTLSEEILSQVVELDSASDEWNELKSKFAKFTVHRELVFISANANPQT